MSKAKHPAKRNRKSKPARNTQLKRFPKSKPDRISQTAALQTDCPYRPGTLYATLFTEGNKDYIPKADLIKKVADMTGKSEKVVEFAFQVLKGKNHRSNKSRSSMIEEDGKVKLVSIRK